MINDALFLIISETWIWVIFSTLIVGYMIYDLGIAHRKPEKISFKSALFQSGAWIVLSLLFSLVILYQYAPPETDVDFYINLLKQKAAQAGGTPETGQIVEKANEMAREKAWYEFITAYLVEYALSVDNIFVIIVILRTFKIEEEYHHEVLFWGILGAVVMRLIFILLGEYLITQFDWILYIFGIFLLYTGFKMLLSSGGEEKHDPEKNIVLRFARRYLRISHEHHAGRFFIRKNNTLYFTKLFLVILLIESTDLIFAIDSIPAAFSISSNIVVLYTSNIFAIMGLRSMFFVLSSVLHKFYLLSYGLSLVLMFIGGKMLYKLAVIGLIYIEALPEGTPHHIPSQVALLITLVLLLGSVVLSVLIPQKKKTESET